MTSEFRLSRQAGGGPLPGVGGATSTSADAGSPVYDELVAAVAAIGAATDVAADGQGPAGQSAVRRAADTVEGMAILALFSRLKAIEEGGGWPGSDVVEQLCGWFDELGIDADDDLAAAARALRLPAQPLTSLPHGSDITVAISAARPAADAEVRTWVSALVTALGPGSSAVVFDAAGEQIAHCAHPDADPVQH